jgi:DnaK suppressor protein
MREFASTNSPHKTGTNNSSNGAVSMKTNPSFDKPLLLHFANALGERRRQLQHLIGNAGKEARELVDAGPCDAIDVSCFSFSKESMFAHSSQNRRQLRLVEMALTRIQDGTFGICAVCYDLIGLKRLQAVPWARLCIECQRRLECHSLPDSVPLLSKTSDPQSPANR